MGNWQGKENRKNTIYRIDEDLQTEFKIICFKKGDSMSDVVSAFIEKYVKYHKNRRHGKK